MKVAEILKIKGNVLYTGTPDMLVLDAISTMVEKDIGCLPVMENGALAGLLSFREIMSAFHVNQGQVAFEKVRSYMNSQPLIITPDSTLPDVRQLLLERHVRYLPVMEGRTLLGVVSFYDIAKAVFEAQHFENKMLKAYIRDWPAAQEE